MLPRATVECGVVRDPEIRFSSSGRAWGTTRVVAKDQVRGPNGEWQDGPPTFFDVITFGKTAENLVESVRTGDLLVVHGKFQEQEWETKEGEKRTSWRLLADEVGVSVRFNPAKTPRALGDSPAGSAVPKAAVTQPAEDPWGTPVGGGEPPF